MTPYYEDDHVTLYHADWRDVPPDLLAADVLVTDPPYGIGFPERPTRCRRLAGRAPESWDAATVDLAPLLPPGRPAIVWGGNHYGLPPSRGWLAWVKPDAPPSMSTFEVARTSLDRTARHIVHPHTPPGERTGHPTQKPLAVMRWCLGFVPAGTVLDPFAGSGSTLVAAKSLGRKAIGVEVEERYCAVAADRLRQEVLGLVTA